jgi:hypothetical protein
LDYTTDCRTKGQAGKCEMMSSSIVCGHKSFTVLVNLLALSRAYQSQIYAEGEREQSKGGGLFLLHFPLFFALQEKMVFM